MPRKVKDAKIDTRTVRLKLKPRGKPYFCRVGPDCHLGYRRLQGRDGTWTVRRYIDGKYVTDKIGSADDSCDANAVTILSFDQAVNAARARMNAAATQAAAPATFAAAVELYLQDIEDEGRDPGAVEEIRRRLERFVMPTFGDTPLAEITTDQLTAWRQAHAKAKPLSNVGKARKKADTRDPEDASRARRATAERLWHNFQAVLNFAFAKGLVASDAPWRRVKSLKNISKARHEYLEVPACKRLINACDPEFRPLVQAALLTGARYGGLISLRVKDFSADGGTVTMRTRKGDGTLRTFHVHLTPEGAAFFKSACAGRKGTDLIFLRADGRPWAKSNQQLLMAAACKHAGIGAAVTFHSLRHTWASLSVMAGMPLSVVAGNLGHTSTKMVENHYGHLAPSYKANQVAKFAPQFGIDAGNVRVLG